MGRLLALILAVVAVTWVASRVLERTAHHATPAVADDSTSVSGPAAPARQLQNVRDAAKQAEAREQQRLDDLAGAAAE